MIMIKWYEDGAWHYFATASKAVFEKIVARLDRWEYV